MHMWGWQQCCCQQLPCVAATYTYLFHIHGGSSMVGTTWLQGGHLLPAAHVLHMVHGVLIPVNIMHMVTLRQCMPSFPGQPWMGPLAYTSIHSVRTLWQAAANHW
jgi:hypothetical protein